jgi:hypothetical protein
VSKVIRKSKRHFTAEDAEKSRERNKMQSMEEKTCQNQSTGSIISQESIESKEFGLRKAS